jgi:hypothetical protein
MLILQILLIFFVISPMPLDPQIRFDQEENYAIMLTLYLFHLYLKKKKKLISFVELWTMFKV